MTDLTLFGRGAGMSFPRGHGRGGRYMQIKMSLDEDAGEGLIEIENRLIQGVFLSGRRSDVIRVLLRHWVDHPPDGLWLKSKWQKPLGAGWPDVQKTAPADESDAELSEEGAPL